METTILLARHGESDWNREYRWQGHADRPLTDTGREQARELSRRLEREPIAAVYSSDLTRAHETARIVAAARGLPVVASARLREIDVGTWQGYTWEEIEHRFPEGFRRHVAYEGPGWDSGETHEQMAERVLAEIAAIAAAHPGEHVLVVTHGGPIRALLARASAVEHAEFRRLQTPVGNTSVARIGVENGSVRLA